MALKGTLKDFGIAEILQLIGQQAKSGVLHLSSRDDQIHVAIAEGNVVRAEATGRKARERLGSMLVRAEIITPQELEYALEQQKRTLRRLGDILVDLRFVSPEDLREMTALQTTETVYRLFHWKSGTYEFEPGAVEWDPGSATPLRAESVLMEGYRRVDEWPLIQRKISSSAVTFLVRKALPERPGSRPTPAPSRAPTTAELDAAFGEATGAQQDEGSAEFAHLGVNERRVHALAAEPGRTVEKIVDLSRLGEFETCKALANLVNLGYLEPQEPASRASAVVGAYAHDWQARLKAGAARVLATVAIAAALAGVAYWLDERGLAWGEQPGAATIRDNTAQRFLARYQMERLRGALEVYRLEKGEYPAGLEALVDADLASPRDLRYPWVEPYYYRRRPEGRFVLLPPLE